MSTRNEWRNKQNIYLVPTLIWSFATGTFFSIQMLKINDTVLVIAQQSLKLIINTFYYEADGVDL